ncbi:hypothetical protein JCM10207_007899 [Rhodosporidiobolus poonsookiae]
MRCFVRDLSGRSLCLEASTVSDLHTAVAQRTSIPAAEQRLSYGARQLVDGPLSSYGISEDATVGLALRLRGGAPKKRCACFIAPTERCSQAAMKIVGDCTLCKASFCARHRLAEDHACPNLETAKQDAFMRNKNKLEAEQTKGEKLARA